jgi:hypothetical protein
VRSSDVQRIRAGRAALAVRRNDLLLPGRPESIRINPASTALIVVDMQNAYASRSWKRTFPL